MGSFGEQTKGRLAAYAAMAILVAVAAFRLLGPGEEEPPAAPVAIGEGAPGGAPEDAADSGARLYVHVAGQVRRPGLYRLPGGTRVGAAIDRAGGVGPAADLTGVNLAAELQDGQQVIVPKRGEAPALTPGSASAPSATGSPADAGSPGAPISLAQATPEQLDAEVDGIGPVLAGRIIEFRDEQGSVDSIDELEGVDGIGEERLAALREALVP